jgi:hypothetical protein
MIGPFSLGPERALRLFNGLEAADAAAYNLALERQRAGTPVDADNEAAASRHMLRTAPLDGTRWLRLWDLLRHRGDPETDRALLRASLADLRQTPEWRAPVARALLAAGEHPRGEAGRAAISLVLGDDPGSPTLAGLLAGCCPRRAGRIAVSLLPARLDDPFIAYHAARALFDAGQRECAIDVLHGLRGAELVHPFTARLLIDMLAHGGQYDEARHAVDLHLAHGPSPIWGQADMQPRRLIACQRGVPPIVIATQPKSGSVFMLNTLCGGLDCPATLVVPLEHLDYLGPARARLAEVAGGGAVCVDHLFANTETLDAVREAGIARLVVHLRDPRAATLSWCHNLVDAAYVSLPRRERIRRIVRRCQASFEADYLEWLPFWCRFQEDWLRALDEGVPGLAFLRTDYDELAAEGAFFDRLLGFFGCEPGLFDAGVLAQSREVRAGHFRKGLRREWESVLSAETLARQVGVIAGFERVARYVAEIDARAG